MPAGFVMPPSGRLLARAQVSRRSLPDRAWSDARIGDGIRIVRPVRPPVFEKQSDRVSYLHEKDVLLPHLRTHIPPWL